MAALLYGFLNLKDVLNTRAIEVDSNLLISAVRDTVANHNDEVNRLLGLFSEDTTDYSLRFQGDIAVRSQPLDENGRSLPIKGAGTYTAAWPIFSSGNAWGTNYVARQKITVQQLNDLTSALLTGDFRRTRDDLLAAIFNSTNGGRTFNDPTYGDLAVQGFANGDATLFVKAGTSQELPATDTHYLGQADAIDDTHNPFPTIFTELMEHPVNSGGSVVCFVAHDLVSSISNLTDFVGFTDSDIILPNTTARLAGSLQATLPPNAVVKGKVSGCWIVEWPSLPSGYIVAVVAGTAAKVIKRRQDPETQLQGFRPAGEREDFPYFEQQWFRRQGFGAWNRVGALAMKIGGVWAIPTGYDKFVP